MNGTIPLNWYGTSDFAEVTLLSTIGIPWADDGNRFSNIYPDHFLRKIGKTAEQAQAEGIPGKVQWWFKRTPELDAALEIHRSVWNVDQKGVEIADESMADVCRGISLALKNRGKLAEDFKRGLPKVAIDRNSEGACSVITSKTTPEALRHMGLTQ